MGTERALENKRTLIESFFNLILCEQCAPAFSTWYYVNSVHQLFQLDTMWTVCTSFFNLILCEQCAPAFSTWYYVNSVHQLFQLDTMWTVCTSFFNLILCEQCAPAFSTWYYVNSVHQLFQLDTMWTVSASFLHRTWATLPLTIFLKIRFCMVVVCLAVVARVPRSGHAAAWLAGDIADHTYYMCRQRVAPTKSHQLLLESQVQMEEFIQDWKWMHCTVVRGQWPRASISGVGFCIRVPLS